MDPLSGLSLAVNIIQVVDFASKVVSTGYHLYKDNSGQTEENLGVEKIASDVQALIRALQKSNDDWLARRGPVIDANEKALEEIFAGCSADAKLLVEQLQKLQHKGRFKGLTAIRNGFSAVWRRDDIDRYKERLRGYREALDTRFLYGLREHLKHIDRTQDERFTRLDDASRDLANAILDHNDTISVQLDDHRVVLEDIRAGQKELLAVLPLRSLSPAPPYAERTFALHDAAQTGDSRGLRKLLLSDQLDPNTRNSEGRVALHCAANAAIAERLLDNGAKINAEDLDGLTPLHTALLDRRLDVFRSLLIHGADRHFKDDKDKSPSDYAANIPAAWFMLRYGTDVEAKAAEHAGNTGLLHMIWLGDEEGTAFYRSLEADAQVANVNGDTALHFAATYGNSELVRSLVSQGVDVNRQNNDGEHALLRAIWQDARENMKILLESGSSTVLSNRWGHNALSCAAFHGRAEAAKLLLDHGADPSRAANPAGGSHDAYSPLNIAASFNQVEVARILLERGADANAQINAHWKWHVLHNAVRDGRSSPEIVKMAIDHGARLESRDRYDHTPLIMACRWGNTSVVKVLLDAGANIKSLARASDQDHDFHDDHSYTPLHKAVMPGRGTPDMVPLLAAYGANLNQQTPNQGWTPLHIAIRGRREHCALALVQAGADFNLASKKSQTPLILAAEKGMAELTKALLEAGADIKKRDFRCVTAEIQARQSNTYRLLGHLYDQYRDS